MFFLSCKFKNAVYAKFYCKDLGNQILLENDKK